MPNYFALNQALQTTAPALFKLVENSQENKILQQGKQKVFEMSQQIDDAILNAPDDASKQSLQQYKYAFEMSPEVNAFKNFEKGNFEQFGKKLKMFQLLPDYKTIIDKTKGADMKITQIGSKPVVGSEIPEAERPQYFNPNSYYQNVDRGGKRTWELVGAEGGGGNYWELKSQKRRLISTALDDAIKIIGQNTKAIFAGRSTEEIIQLLSGNPAALSNIITTAANNDKAKEEAMKNEVKTLATKWRANLADDPELQAVVDKMIEQGAIGSVGNTTTLGG